MINVIRDSRGNFQSGNICCDNKRCQKTLYEWFKENASPSGVAGRYSAYSVKTRFLFSKFPTTQVLSAISPSIVFPLPDGHIGYSIDFDSTSVKLDFCSSNCSLAWLDGSEVYRGKSVLKNVFGVVFYKHTSQDNFQLVADNPSRFETVLIGNYFPTSAPKNQYQFPDVQKVIIAGEKFEVRQSASLRPGESKPAIGISMNALTFRCPIKLDSARRCNQAIQVVLDLRPSLWVCPECRGIVVIDDAGSNWKYPNANETTNFSLGSEVVQMNFYYGKPNWGDMKFIKWIRKNIDSEVVAFADIYENSEMFKAPLLSRIFMSANDVLNLFARITSPDHSR